MIVNKTSCLFRYRWLLGIMALSFAVKMLFLLRSDVINPDAVTYIAAAQKHAQGLFAEGLQRYSMPFYPLVLAAVHSVIPSWIRAGQCLTLIPLVLALWPLYLLTNRLFGHAAAIWAALLFAVLPAFNHNVTNIMRDPLFLMCSLTAILCLVIGVQDRKIVHVLWFSLWTTLAILIRIEGVILPLAALISVVVLRQQFHWSWQSLLRSAIAVALIPLLLVFALYIFAKFGIVSNSRLHDLTLWWQQLWSLQFFAEYQRLMAQLHKIQYTLPSSRLHNNLVETTRHYAPLIYLVGIFELIFKALFPTSLVALWARRWGKEQPLAKERWIVVTLCLLVIVLNLVFSIKRNFTTERYLWLAIVSMLPFVGHGIAAMCQRYHRRKVALVAIGIFFIAAPLGKSLMTLAHEKDITIITAGQWLDGYATDNNKNIFYNDRRLPLYADRVEDINMVRSMGWLRKNVKHIATGNLLAIYLSNPRKIDLDTTTEWREVKAFVGKDKKVIILERL